MTDGPPTFGERMRQAREARGWTIRQLAQAAGVDAAWVSRLEGRERQNVSLGTAKRIARALLVSLDWLADTFGDSEPSPASVDMLPGAATLAVASRYLQRC